MAETIDRWWKGRNRNTRKKTLMMNFRKCHILKRTFKPQARLELTLQHWWHAWKADVLRPKIHRYTGCKRTECIKPGRVKLAMGHLLLSEAALWNHALQTRVPLWIQGLVRQDLSTLLWQVAQCTCIEWSVAVSPLSATVGSLHLTQFAVPFVQIVTTVCKACDSTFFMTRAVHRTRFLGLGLDLINPLFFEPVGTSPHPAIWLRKVRLLSSHSEPWVDATSSFEIEHPGCAENQAVAKPPELMFCFLHWSNTQYSLLYSTRLFTPCITVYFGPYHYCRHHPKWSDDGTNTRLT